MENIIKALGDNAKFYDDYLDGRVASDFKFHLNIGIGRLVEESAELREMLKVAVKDVDCYGEFTSSSHKKAKDLLNKLKQP